MALGLYVLDVGQANCTAVIEELPDGQVRALLIDVGGDGTRIAAWLREAGVDHIPLIAVTHNDEDHVSGLPAVVCEYEGQIDRLCFLIDRPPERIPFWSQAQEWLADKCIQTIERLEAPATAAPGMGRRLIEPAAASYTLNCIFPGIFESAAARHGASTAPLVGQPVGRGPNATSAALRMNCPSTPRDNVVLWGGDLDLRGWRRLHADGHDLSADILVVPHHGAPRYAPRDFKHRDLAEAVHPTDERGWFGLVSVGTQQKHGRRASGRHPRPEMIRGLRDAGATVLCTEITRRCVTAPGETAGTPVLAKGLTNASCAPGNGVACAGTICVVLPDDGPPSVLRLEGHQRRVDELAANGQTPLCRP